MCQRKPDLEGANYRGKSRTTAKEPALKQSVIAKRWRITAPFDQSSSKKEEKDQKRQGGNHDAEAHGGKNDHRVKWGSVGN